MTRQPNLVESKPSRACKCKKCERVLDPGINHYKVTTTSTYFWLCAQCATSLASYSATTEKKNMRANKHGVTFSLEHEQSGDVLDYRALIIDGWKASSDGSVDREYKSPIYSNIRGLKLTLNTLERANATSGDHFAGSHIHVGTFTQDEKIKLYNNAYNLFIPLMRIILNESSVERINFWGRDFGGYRQDDTNFVHGSWLNLRTRHDTIEWRLPKFVSANQYYKVVIFAYMSGKILRDYLDGKISDVKTGNKIVALYRKCKLARDVSDIIGNNNRLE